SEADRCARFVGDDLDTRRGQLAQALGCACEQTERAEVARNAALRADELECECGFFGSHREVVADGQNDDVRAVQLPDQRHVAENARITCEVDGDTALEPHDDAASLPEVASVCGTRRMERVCQREPDAVDLLAATLVDSWQLADRGTLLPEPRFQFHLGDNVRLELSG